MEKVKNNGFKFNATQMVVKSRMQVLQRVLDNTAEIAQDLAEIRRLTYKLMDSTKAIEAYDTATELLETCQTCNVGCRWEHKRLAVLICELDELLNGSSYRKAAAALTKESTPEEINAVIDEMIKAKDRYMALKTSR